MSKINEKLKMILSEGEKQIREVISEAAKQGDYGGVDTAKNVAVRIGEIGSQLEGKLQNDSTKGTKTKETKVRKKDKTDSRRSRSTDYPRFKISKDDLTKIGWSKKQKREYSHKVPRTIFKRTLQTIDELTSSGTGPFTTEQIIDTLNASNNEFVPSYQVYIVIAFLRNMLCIKQLGRDGYEIPTDVADRAAEAWNDKCKGGSL